MSWLQRFSVVRVDGTRADTLLTFRGSVNTDTPLFSALGYTPPADADLKVSIATLADAEDASQFFFVSLPRSMTFGDMASLMLAVNGDSGISWPVVSPEHANSIITIYDFGGRGSKRFKALGWGLGSAAIIAAVIALCSTAQALQYIPLDTYNKLPKGTSKKTAIAVFAVLLWLVFAIGIMFPGVAPPIIATQLALPTKPTSKSIASAVAQMQSADAGTVFFMR